MAEADQSAAADDAPPDSELPPWPDDVYVRMSGPVGFACYGLLFSERRWVHRRVETVSVLSRELARRAVSVDFTVPELFRNQLKIPGVDQWVVPIATLPKRRLRNFDLRDESARAVPLLGRVGNSRIAAGALIAAAWVASDAETPNHVSKLLRNHIDEVTIGLPPAAQTAIFAILRASDTGDAEAAAFLDDPRAVSLLLDLSENYLLLAVVDDIGTRRILKYAYDAPLERGPLKAALPIRLAWQPLQIETAVPSASRGESYHAEVEIPEELRIDGSFVYDEETGHVHGVDGSADRGSIYVSDLPLDAEARLVFAVRPERVGFPLVAVATSWLTTFLLIVGGWFGDLDPTRAGSAVSLLLAGSALLSGAVVRSGEHRLVQAHFSLPRLVLAANAVAGLVAASFLAFDLCRGSIDAVWKVAAVFAFAMACILTVTFYRSAPTNE